MKQIVDARGLACPQPVVLTLKATALADQITTIVDNQAAVENVGRLARSKGFTVEVAQKDDGIYMTLVKEGVQPETAVIEHVVVCSSAAGPIGPTVLFVPSDCFGVGPAELGQRLIAAFFHSLLELDSKPNMIIFMNSGVKLVVEGARTLDDVKALAEQGIEILACGTCLSYFELTEKLAVGQISNMYDIATALLEAGKIVKL